MRIAVAGATGLIGRLVHAEAVPRGHVVVALSRATGVDLLAGVGLVERLEGVEVVIDCLNTGRRRAAEVEQFFATTSSRLLAAERVAGVPHHVVLSVLGIEAVAMAHYRGKLAQERVVASGAGGWTVQRVTQFHEFSRQVLDMMRVGPVSVVPRMLTQPVAASEAASRLVDLAEQEPGGRVPDFAGPERWDMSDLARRTARRMGLRRWVVPVRVPGPGAAVATGALLPSSDGPRGSITYQQWVDSLAGEPPT